MSSKQLVADIDAFLRRPGVGMTETTFGRLAVNDGKLVARIREGGRVWPETELKVRDFIAARTATRTSSPPKPAPKTAAARA